MGLVNEQELGKSVADSLAPHLEAAQTRAERFLLALLAGNDVKIKIPLGDSGRTVEATLSLVPK